MYSLFCPLLFSLVLYLAVCLPGAMDCFARGLRSAVKIVEDGLFDRHVKVCSFLCSNILNRCQVSTVNINYHATAGVEAQDVGRLISLI